MCLEWTKLGSWLPPGMYACSCTCTLNTCLIGLSNSVKHGFLLTAVSFIPVIFKMYCEFIGLINYFSNESNLFLFGILLSLCFKYLNIALITYLSTNK